MIEFSYFKPPNNLRRRYVSATQKHKLYTVSTSFNVKICGFILMKKLIFTLFFLMFSQSLLFAEENVRNILTIGFNHAGGINKPTKCIKSEILKAFPDSKVEKAIFDDTYKKTAKGFHVYLNNNVKPVFSLSCVDLDEMKKNGSSYWGAENKTGKYIFLARTRSSLVKGPSDSIVGKTTFKEMKNLKWATGIDGGCSFGQNDLKNTMICLGSQFRALFVAPVDYKEALKQAPPRVIDSAILHELLYWPGLKDK